MGIHLLRPVFIEIFVNFSQNYFKIHFLLGNFPQILAEILVKFIFCGIFEDFQQIISLFYDFFWEISPNFLQIHAKSYGFLGFLAADFPLPETYRWWWS